MQILLIILIVLFLLLLWLMVTPIIFRIDSEQALISFRIGGLGGARLIWIEYEPILVISVFGFKKRFYPYKWKQKSKTTEGKPKEKLKKAKGSSFGKRLTFQRVRRLIRTFYVKEFNLNLDTEDVILNAYLFPFFYFLNRNQIHATINYNQEFLFRCEIHNQLYKLVYAFIR